MVRLTRAQREALQALALRDGSYIEMPSSVHNRRKFWRGYRKMRRNVQPLFGGGGCVMVKWAGMWLGIEPDGYTHS